MAQNKVTADEIITQKHKRTFVQWEGPYPGNPVKYAGQDGQYMAIDGVTIPESGGVDPIWVPDPNQQGRYRLIGRTISPPDLAQATLMMREKHKLLPKQLTPLKCPFNIYEVTGPCRDLSDFVRGWSDYVLIYSLGLVTDKDLGTRTSWDADDAMEDSLSLTLANIYPVGPLAFGQEAASQVDREVTDIVYGGRQSCGNCGPSDDGSQRIYAVTKSSGGSPGLPSEVVYTLDGGTSWNQTNITGIGAGEYAGAVEVVGSYLVVLGSSAYYYAEIDTDTGAPGTFTKVTTGFEVAGVPRDLYVLSSREVYFCGDAGYLYKSTDITAGVTVVLDGSVYTDSLKRVSGTDESIVTVGANGQIIYSNDRGATWVASNTIPTSSTLQAIDVKSSRIWWVGSINGYVFYTKDGGKSWSQLNFAGQGSGQVFDIVSATEEVMYIARADATPTASILTTWDGGQDWTTAAPRIMNLPVFDRPNRIAIPPADPGIAANAVAVAGLAGNGTDGIVLVAVAARL